MESLNQLERAATLTALALNAVVAWDDVTDNLEDQQLRADLGITEGQIDEISAFLRDFFDRVTDFKNDRKAEVTAALEVSPDHAPTQVTNLDRAWQAVHEHHRRPPESQLLGPGAMAATSTMSRPTPRRPGPESTDSAVRVARLRGVNNH